MKPDDSSSLHKITPVSEGVICLQILYGAVVYRAQHTIHHVLGDCGISKQLSRDITTPVERYTSNHLIEVLDPPAGGGSTAGGTKSPDTPRAEPVNHQTPPPTASTTTSGDATTGSGDAITSGDNISSNYPSTETSSDATVTSSNPTTEPSSNNTPAEEPGERLVIREESVETPTDTESTPTDTAQTTSETFSTSDYSDLVRGLQEEDLDGLFDEDPGFFLRYLWGGGGWTTSHLATRHLNFQPDHGP